MSNLPFPTLLSQKEVAEILRLPVATLRFYRNLQVKHGEFKGPKSAIIGGKVMYREQDVFDYINAQFEGGSDD